MSSAVSIVRTFRSSSLASPSAYHVIMSSGAVPFALIAGAERDRRVVDGITALLIGPTPLESVVAELPGEAAALVVEIPSVLTSRWALPAPDESFGGTRLVRRTVAMSASSLILAQQLRQRGVAEQPFLDEMIADLFDAPPSDAPRPHLIRRRVLVDRARRRLADSPGAPHPLPELADALGVSTFHFARVFKAETGLSVHRYLLRLRMAGALERLSRGETDLSRLALDLGFSSHSHFTATFHREFGVNPARVRHMLDGERRCAPTRYLA